MVYHKPVLLQESIEALNIKEEGVYIDATLGGAGHTREILSHLGAQGKLVVFDKDATALQNAPEDERVIKVHGNFRFIENYMRFLRLYKAEGILADLGVSSYQFDTAERGFSYRFEAELDMRMNTLSKTTAADIVKSYTKEELARIFTLYGELSNAKKVAELIAGHNIHTTGELCRALAPLYNAQTERKFLGKVFQALRIEVNGEMRAIEDLLKGSSKILKKGGRLAVITYHSLEDRIVKNFIRDKKAEGEFLPINKKPILPCLSEIQENGRSRSAKLRIAEKIKDE